jgi:hypothetical protein
MMIISPDFAEQTTIPAGKLAEILQAYAREQQTGLVTLDPGQGPLELLLFARGQLVTAYHAGTPAQRLEPAAWMDSVNGSYPQVSMRSLALTPQDVRIFKILVEQQDAAQMVSTGGQSLEKLLSDWMKHPIPALAQVRWPRAEALVMFPGEGAAPYYSLFITSDQVLHAARDSKKLLGWKESYTSASLFSSSSHTLAWTEYLLHSAFSSLVVSLFGKCEKLVGRLTLNQVIRDVNFKASAHDWNLSVNMNSVNDQTIFATATAAAEMYARLLETIFRNFESVLGITMLQMLVRESIHRMPEPFRVVLKEYLPVTEISL